MKLQSLLPQNMYSTYFYIPATNSHIGHSKSTAAIRQSSIPDGTDCVLHFWYDFHLSEHCIGQSIYAIAPTVPHLSSQHMSYSPRPASPYPRLPTYPMGRTQTDGTSQRRPKSHGMPASEACPAHQKDVPIRLPKKGCLKCLDTSRARASLDSHMEG